LHDANGQIEGLVATKLLHDPISRQRGLGSVRPIRGRCPASRT
jgi:hypothetical protein